MAELSIKNLEHLEKDLFEKAKFLNICVYHGTKPFKDCISEAVQEKIGMSDSAFYSLFGIYTEDYVNYLYSKVEIEQ